MAPQPPSNDASADTARNQTLNLFCPKCLLIPLGHILKINGDDDDDSDFIKIICDCAFVFQLYCIVCQCVSALHKY